MVLASPQAMLAKVNSCAVIGLDGEIVEVEVDINNQGLPKFSVVGLGDTAVQEARERVRSAIRNSGLKFPTHIITVNLAPADLRKEGPAYDLPIAVGILIASGQVPAPRDGCVFLGELSLDGRLRHTNGVLPMVGLARERGFTTVFVPAADAGEAALVEGVEVIPVASLLALAEHLRFGEQIEPFVPQREADLGEGAADSRDGLPRHQGAGAREARARSGGGGRAQRADGRAAGLRQDAAGPRDADDPAADDVGRGAGGDEDLQRRRDAGAGARR